MTASSPIPPPRGKSRSTKRAPRVCARWWGASVSACVLLLAGITMAFLALFIPPPGEIHESVLYIFAQILIYAGSVFGIDAYIKKLLDERNHNQTPTAM